MAITLNEKEKIALNELFISIKDRKSFLHKLKEYNKSIKYFLKFCLIAKRNQVISFNFKDIKKDKNNKIKVNP